MTLERLPIPFWVPSARSSGRSAVRTQSPTPRLPRHPGADDSTGNLQAAWQVKEQLRTSRTPAPSRTGAVKKVLAGLVTRAAMPETNRLCRIV